jgi:hypothetical protein
MMTTRDLHFASAIGPPTREQLKQWAVEHDRMWERKIRVRRVVVGGCCFPWRRIVGAACTDGLHVSRIGTWRASDVDFSALTIEGLAIGVFATTWVDRMVRYHA